MAEWKGELNLLQDEQETGQGGMAGGKLMCEQKDKFTPMLLLLIFKGWDEA